MKTAYLFQKLNIIMKKIGFLSILCTLENNKWKSHQQPKLIMDRSAPGYSLSASDFLSLSFYLSVSVSLSRYMCVYTFVRVYVC